MVKLQCRSCGGKVDSDEKARKCRHCNELFPFECAVCAKHMRPPIPEFPVERYYNEALQPLCADHYQRECPECNRWFRADENPGFYLCPDCTQQRENGDASSGDSRDTRAADRYQPDETERDKSDHDPTETEEPSRAPRERAKTGAGCVGAFLIVVGAACTPVAWFCARALLS